MVTVAKYKDGRFTETISLADESAYANFCHKVAFENGIFSAAQVRRIIETAKQEVRAEIGVTYKGVTQDLAFKVTLGGGRGPSAWTKIVPIHAPSIRDALDIAENHIVIDDCAVVAIEQE